MEYHIGLISLCLSSFLLYLLLKYIYILYIYISIIIIYIYEYNDKEIRFLSLYSTVVSYCRAKAIVVCHATRSIFFFRVFAIMRYVSTRPFLKKYDRALSAAEPFKYKHNVSILVHTSTQDLKKARHQGHFFAAPTLDTTHLSHWIDIIFTNFYIHSSFNICCLSTSLPTYSPIKAVVFSHG